MLLLIYTSIYLLYEKSKKERELMETLYCPSMSCRTVYDVFPMYFGRRAYSGYIPDVYTCHCCVGVLMGVATMLLEKQR